MPRSAVIQDNGTLKNNIAGRTSYRIYPTAKTIVSWFSGREIGYDS